MQYFSSNMLPELRNLPASDRETIMQTLHWAIAEDVDKIVIPLNYFRDGEHLQIRSYEFSELYDAFKRD